MNNVVFNALEMKKTRLPLSDLHSLMFNILITLTIFLIFLITLAVFFLWCWCFSLRRKCQ